MSAVDSIDRPVSAIEERAAAGDLPSWACAGPERRAHMRRVADLLESWAAGLSLPAHEVSRWRAAGFLHDVLRDADPAELRPLIDPADRDLPARVLHGPAAAARLRGEVAPNLLEAIRYHTIGHPDLDDLGRALYLADFLEPGRPQQREWRESLRARMPGERGAVLLEVLDARIRHLLDRRAPIRGETAAFWSAVVKEDLV